MTTGGGGVVPRAQPVPAAPPTTGEVLRHGANVGLGALGLARRAAGRALSRVQPGDRHAPPPTPPTTLELVPGAIAGLALVVERQVRTMLDRAASATADTARIVTRPALVQRALSPIEDRLWQWNEIARREQARNRAEASALIPLIVQQVTENVVAQIDFVRVIEQVPMEEIVSHIDVEALVARIDLAGVIRESTSSLTGEAVDSLRDQGMALDALSARIVDRVLFRRKARKLGVTGR
ncbi:MAG TPA: hypothetical protein VH986_10435 [Acidimicrobiia bacterium]